MDFLDTCVGVKNTVSALSLLILYELYNVVQGETGIVIVNLLFLFETPDEKF